MYTHSTVARVLRSLSVSLVQVRLLEEYRLASVALAPSALTDIESPDTCSGGSVVLPVARCVCRSAFQRVTVSTRYMRHVSQLSPSEGMQTQLRREMNDNRPRWTCKLCQRRAVAGARWGCASRSSTLWTCAKGSQTLLHPEGYDICERCFKTRVGDVGLRLASRGADIQQRQSGSVRRCCSHCSQCCCDLLQRLCPLVMVFVQYLRARQTIRAEPASTSRTDMATSLVTPSGNLVTS